MEGWISQYQDRGALWLHDGNPRRPHALLSAGDHSSGFFNSELVMEDAVMLDEASSDLVELLIREGIDPIEISRVIGPSMGAITLVHDLSRHISRIATRTTRCLRGYTEKHQEITTVVNGTKITVRKSEVSMVFERGSPLLQGEWILSAEDVLTTGLSVENTAKAIRAAGGIPMPYVAVIVNRSGLTEVDGRKIVALIDRSMPKWAPNDCPLCAQGSVAISAKGDNWARLNATY